MEEIDVMEIIHYFKKKIPTMLLIVFFIGALGGLYIYLIKKPVYSSSTTIVLTSSDTSNNSTTNLQENVTLNQKLVNTYREIIKSRKVLERVIDDLILDYSYETLANNIAVSSINNTEIIKITVTDISPITAQKIATNISFVFKDQITEMYNMQNVNILDEANRSLTPSNSHLKDILVFLGIGFFISVVIIFITYYFDNKLKSVEQIEHIIDLPILGIVPINKGGKKQ